MPRAQGNEVLERIRHLSGDLPVLALSSNDCELEKVRTLRSGADDYVMKPFGNLELVARVETLLRRARRAAPASSTISDDLVSVDFEHAAAPAWTATSLRSPPWSSSSLPPLCATATRC